MNESPFFTLLKGGAIRPKWWERALLLLVPGETTTVVMPGGDQRIITKTFRGKTYIIEVNRGKAK